MGSSTLARGRHGRYEVEGLKDEADLAVAYQRQIAAAQMRDVVAVQIVAAAIRLVQQSENVHHGRLARTRGTHDGEEFARHHAQIDPGEGLHHRLAFAVGATQIVNLDDGGLRAAIR
jgi:hypothetical protein